MKNTIKYAIKDLYRYLQSPKIYNPKIPPSTESIVFVCKGNICRSPFAEHVAYKIASERSLGEMTFSSVGLEVNIPLASPNDALAIADKFGVKLDSHKSQVISNDIVGSYDMIIGMETWHIIKLRKMFPKFRERIFLLSLFDINNNIPIWSYRKNNIIDPYGKSLSNYYECYKRINRCVDELLSQVKDKRNEIMK